MDQGDEFPASEFWDFSLEVYGRAGVAPACLALQESRGIDVNLLLFGCWVGASGRGVLGSAEFARVLAATEPWQNQVVAPMRSVRRRLKTADAPRGNIERVRRRIAAAELDAEHVEQLMIVAAAPRGPCRDRPLERCLGDAAENLKRYLAAVGVVAGAADRAHVAALLAGAFPSVEEDRIKDRLSASFGGG